MAVAAPHIPDPTNLTPFDGEPVKGIAVEIPGLAGGLRDSMKIDPIEHHRGERVWILAECVVDKFHHDPLKSKEGDFHGWRRVEILAPDTVMFVGPEDAAEKIERHRNRIQRAKDAAAGQPRLPTDEELFEAHAEGAHTELVDGCVECDREKAAAEAERPPDPTPLAGRKPRGRTRKSAE